MRILNVFFPIFLAGLLVIGNQVSARTTPSRRPTAEECLESWNYIVTSMPKGYFTRYQVTEVTQYGQRVYDRTLEVLDSSPEQYVTESVVDSIRAKSTVDKETYIQSCLEPRISIGAAPEVTLLDQGVAQVEVPAGSFTTDWQTNQTSVTLDSGTYKTTSETTFTTWQAKLSEFITATVKSMVESVTTTEISVPSGEPIVSEFKTTVSEELVEYRL